MNNDNGEPAMITAGGSAEVALQQVVHTHAADGTTTIYVDGSEVVRGNVPGDFSNWGNYPLLLILPIALLTASVAIYAVWRGRSNAHQVIRRK